MGRGLRGRAVHSPPAVESVLSLANGHGSLPPRVCEVKTHKCVPSAGLVRGPQRAHPGGVGACVLGTLPSLVPGVVQTSTQKRLPLLTCSSTSSRSPLPHREVPMHLHVTLQPQGRRPGLWGAPSDGTSLPTQLHFEGSLPPPL